MGKLIGSTHPGTRCAAPWQSLYSTVGRRQELRRIVCRSRIVRKALLALKKSISPLVAVSLGGTVPLLLKRIGVDPAVASGPTLTTVTDMCGFFLVLSLATMVLPKLAGP